MTNYISIGGRKTELTDEQVRQPGFSFALSVEEISRIVQSGRAREHREIRDTLNLCGLELEIIGFNHDAPNSITLMGKTLLDNHRMHGGACMTATAFARTPAYLTAMSVKATGC